MFDDVVVQPEGLGCDVAEVLAALAGPAAPGANGVAMLACLDPDHLSQAERIDLIAGLERQLAWLSACQIRAIAALRPVEQAGLAVGLDGCEFVSLDLGAALRLSPTTAQSRLDDARQLTERLPATLTALATGTISYRHAHAIVDATQDQPASVASAVEQRVLLRAGRQSVAELRRALRRAIITADPAGAQSAADQAAADRRVETWPLPDGMAELRLIAPAPDVTLVFNALTALASRPTASPDARSLGARRADALTAVFTSIFNDPGQAADGAAGGAAGEAGETASNALGRHALINVTVAASTLLGEDDQAGDLTGYGPITAQTARTLAADCTAWLRALYNPADGQLLHYGRTTYAPPAALRRHITARDQTCTFPHCGQPAARCDIDHAIPWRDGGTTDPANCGALCRRHHRAKTHAGWKLRRHDDNTAVWTSPTGHTYTDQPPGYADP